MSSIHSFVSCITLVVGVLGSPMLAGTGVALENAKPLTKPPGKKPLDSTLETAVSKSGRFVVFGSSDAGIVKGIDPAGNLMLYRLDRKLGKIELVSRASNGAPADDDCFYPSVSADGRRVAFSTVADNLGAAGNGKYQVGYVDLANGESRIVSKTWAGVIANDHCSYVEISGDGRYIAFASAATTLKGPSLDHTQIFIYDVEKDQLTASSFNDEGAWANGDCYSPALSHDGRWLTYLTKATNVPAPGFSTKQKIVLLDRKTGNSELISANAAGFEANADAFGNAISKDGRYVAYLTHATNVGPVPLAPGTPSAIVVDRAKKKIFRYAIDVAGDPFELSLSDDARRFLVNTWQTVPGTQYTAYRSVVVDRAAKQSWPLDLIDADATNGEDSVHEAVLSGNGRRVFFGSGSTKLVSPDASMRHLYVVPVVTP